MHISLDGPRRLTLFIVQAPTPGLVFAYCQRYQEIYWFDQLENAFAFLGIALTDDAEAIRSELGSVRSEVEDAMGEMFESLNEVATAVYRLLDEKPMITNDAISCVAHVWNAHACNEDPSDFRQREDRILCDLLASATDSP